MASSLDISPSLGHGIVTAQSIPGGYDAIDDRRQWAVGRQEGATTALAYKVTERAEGANLSVDIATNEGAFLVQGDDVDFQGLYLIPGTALKANLDLADPPDITNPRVDQVVLEARDDLFYGSDGSTRGRLYVLTGTPTSGADVPDSAAYTSSRAALPDSTARVAEFVVDANATSIVAADIRDRRTWANGARAIVKTTTGGDIAITTSAAELDTTNMKPRIEVSGNYPVTVSLRARFAGGVGASVYLTPAIDGDDDTGNEMLFLDLSSGNRVQSVAVSRTLFPTAGSHRFSWFARVATGSTATLERNSARPFELVVSEDLRPNATNG
jgi:hypothetical protein